VKSALVVLCVVCCALIARAWVAWPPESLAAQPGVLPDEMLSPARDGLLTTTDSQVATILGRPAFSPDRRQPAAVATAGTESGSGASPTPPRLAGILMSPGNVEALFDGGGGRYLTARRGDVVDGWTVALIDGQHVVVIGAAGEVVLSPTAAKSHSAQKD
jgi:hypothetical protein